MNKERSMFVFINPQKMGPETQLLGQKYHTQASGWICNDGELQGCPTLCLQAGTTRTSHLKEIIFHALNTTTSLVHLKTGLHVIAAQSTEIRIKTREIIMSWCNDIF